MSGALADSSAARSGPSSSVAASSRLVWAPPMGSRTISSMMPLREQIGRRQLQRGGGLDLLPRVAPENRGAAFGRDDAVDRVLLHQDAIADRDAQRAAAAPLAGDDDDDRHLQHRHLAQVEGDRFGDAALFGFDARIRRRRIDEDDDRPAELFGHAHQPDGLAIALGPRVAEVAVDLLLGVAALVMADDHHRLPFVAGGARHDGVIVGEAAVAVELDEIGEEPHRRSRACPGRLGWRATRARAARA